MAASPHYVEYAVKAMHDRYSSQLATELAAVETEDELAAGALTEPVEIIDYFAPNDTRTPLLQIYDDEGIQDYDQRNRIWTIPVATVLSYSSGADLSAAAAFVRRYVTALLRVVQKDWTLGGTVMQATFTGADIASVGDTSATRHHYALGHAVQIYESTT